MTETHMQVHAHTHACTHGQTDRQTDTFIGHKYIKQNSIIYKW